MSGTIRGFSEQEVNTLTNALATAARVYDEHAASCRRDDVPDRWQRLAEQFDRQAAAARALAARFDDAEVQS